MESTKIREIDALKVATDTYPVFPILNDAERELRVTLDAPRNDWFDQRHNYFCGQWVRNWQELHPETRAQ